jgi:uncharacterized protein
MIDDHTHPFALEGGPLDLDALSLDVEPDEDGRLRRLGPTRVFQELLTSRLSHRLGCDPADLSQARAEASSDWQGYASALFADAGLTALIMDPAYPPGASERVDEYARLSGCGVHPLLRIDPIVDRLIDEGSSAQEIVDGVLAAMHEAAVSGYVGFKTILAYRTGLAVDPEASLQDAEASLRMDGPVRRRGGALRHLIVRQALGVAADLGKPFQIHTGFGDSEIRLAESNPLLLEELLRSWEGRAANIVLIHGSFPWAEELAYLALTKPNVWADVSLFNIFSPLTTADRVLRLVDLAPAAKLLMGTDGFHEPELFWFAALILQEAWQDVRRTLKDAGASDAWTDRMQRLVFEDNAKELYGI